MNNAKSVRTSFSTASWELPETEHTMRNTSINRNSMLHAKHLNCNQNNKAICNNNRYGWPREESKSNKINVFSGLQMFFYRNFFGFVQDHYIFVIEWEIIWMPAITCFLLILDFQCCACACTRDKFHSAFASNGGSEKYGVFGVDNKMKTSPHKT